MTVRVATRNDEADLMALCRELHEENGLFSMDDDMVRGILHRAFDRQGGVIGVIDGQTQIEAAIYMLISNFWYSKDSHLEELYSYVRPAYRKSTHAAELLKFAKECSDKIGIPLVIGILTAKRMEAKVRMYSRELGVPAGAWFVYGSKWELDTHGLDIWRTHTRDREARKRQLEMSTTTTSALPMMPVAKSA